MNSTTSASVEGVMPSLDIIIGTDRLSVNAPGTGWTSVGVDPSDAEREHATYNQSILPLIIAKR